MSSSVSNIHDAFFKQALSNRKLADAFLRDHLPREVAALLGPRTPEPVRASFVDERLRQHHSDLLFRVFLKNGAPAFAYVLIEHKSSPDPAARLQLLRYVVRILSDWYAQNGQRLPLPVVLPMLAHQGPLGWKFSCESIDLFGGVPNVLRPYLPSFRHVLLDLPRVQDRDLSTDVRLRAYLKALKYSRRRDLPARMDAVLAEAAELRERDLFVILTYLDKGPVRVSIRVIQKALQRLAPDRKERIMGWLTQPYYDKGKAVGKAEGKAEGRAEGEAKILIRFLERRFGTLPTSLRERILRADVTSLETWAERAFDAHDLESIFDAH